MEEIVRNQVEEDEIETVPYDTEREDLMLQLASEFMTLDFDTVDPVRYLRSVHSLFTSQEEQEEVTEAAAENVSFSLLTG